MAVTAEAMKKCFDIMQQLLKQMEAVQRSTQKRIDDELTPVIKRSFKYHDKDATLSFPSREKADPSELFC